MPKIRLKSVFEFCNIVGLKESHRKDRCTGNWILDLIETSTYGKDVTLLTIYKGTGYSVYDHRTKQMYCDLSAKSCEAFREKMLDIYFEYSTAC